FGELFIVKETHISTLETFVTLMMVLLIIVIIRISDKAKELHKESQIKEAEDNRNALLSKMIGSIAHEWRQPLGTVTAITTKVMLKNQMGTLDSKMLEADMHKIEEIAQQLSGIINQFHHIFSTDIFQEKFHIVPFLEEIVQKQSENPEKNNIIFENELPVDTKVQYSKSELSMVILAVVANAFDHSLDKDDLITVKLFSRDSNICIAIENRGEPIDSDKVAMIFDPYYSTKPENQGVGLGLYIAKTLVQKNGGSMQVQNSSNGVIVNICMKKE
ncbi:MAG: HAMP domain-containing histidine kinase, partial [Thiovulaceae bacterium]|nr:HAMP domain-containing histidine kinase [Sulfurimonadaceae bacterium]